MSIEIENLCKKFGATPVLQNFSWTVDRPMVLMGRSGCGKTTLLRILLGLETADSGTVTGVETPVAVFQEDRLCPQLTAAVNLTLTGHGLSPQEAERELRGLGFTDAELALPAARLSGGQKRRVAIAGVIAMEPEVLVLDEPSAGLDPRGREELLAHIRAYHKERGNTVVLVSHSMDEIAQNVDRIAVLSDAHVLMSGTPREVFARADELVAAGLDVPQVTRVAMALRAKGLPIDPAVYTVAELKAALLALRKGGAVC